MHAKHYGYESMHIEMVLVLIAALAVAQIVLSVTAKTLSITQFTLLYVWVVPLYFTIRLYWCRSLSVWGMFSVINSHITFRATCLEQSFFSLIRCLVYKCFLLIYKLIYAFGIVDYLAIMFGFNLHQYYICSDYMASTICVSAGDHHTENYLQVCGQKIFVDINEEGIIENTYQLSCNPVFHKSYFHGWCLVSKNQAYSCCLKKVDSKRMLSNPYPLPNKQLLDWLCYLVVRQPVVISIIQDISYSMGLEYDSDY
uniref:Ring finger protein 175 n=1 Tax=Strigops habroptila TaxID=2489341 RepID=A0A672UBT1_STRHB